MTEGLTCLGWKRARALVLSFLVGACGARTDGSADLTPTIDPASPEGAIIQSANGSYGAGCLQRSSGEWSVLVDPGASADHALLSVVAGNAACELTLTSLRTGPDASQLYMASPTIVLTADYQSPGSAFRVNVSDPAAFYASARLSALGFTGPFGFSVLFSGTPRLVTGSKNASFSYRTQVENDLPISYWRLGEASGTTAVDATGASDGTYSGGFVLGATGALAHDLDPGVDMNGTDGTVSIPRLSAHDLATAVTLEAWCKPDSLSGTRFIVNNGSSYSLYIDSGSIVFGIRTAAGLSTVQSSAVTTGTWQHFVGTYDGASLTLYGSGTSLASLPLSGAIVASTTALNIGASDDVPTAPFDGAIDEVAIYGTALSPTRILAHHQSGL